MQEEIIKEFAAIEEKVAIKDAYMQDWVFHYNIFTKLWNAIPRELYSIYWNDVQLTDVLRAKHLNVLLDLIHRCKGDIEMIKEIASDDLQ